MIAVCAVITVANALELTDRDRERLAAGGVVVQTHKIDGKRRVEAAIRMEHSAGDIWRVMLDCASAPEFVPNMLGCRILDRAEDSSWEIIEHEVEYGWLAPKTVYQFKADYVFQKSIRFVRTSGDLKHLVGAWTLEPFHTQSGSVLVSYSVYIDPGFIVPGFVTRSALRNDLPDVMRALRRRVGEVQGRDDGGNEH